MWEDPLSQICPLALGGRDGSGCSCYKTAEGMEYWRTHCRILRAGGCHSPGTTKSNQTEGHSSLNCCLWCPWVESQGAKHTNCLKFKYSSCFLSGSRQRSLLDNRKYEGPRGGEQVEGTPRKEVGRETLYAWMNTDPWFLGYTPSDWTQYSFCSCSFSLFPLPLKQRCLLFQKG